jgi:hypothetical protein
VKYSVTRFKSLSAALKEIEPMVRDPWHLQTGKPLAKFGGTRPRELLANWLLCAMSEKIEGRKLLFYSDPTGGDGIIRDEDRAHLCLAAQYRPRRQNAHPGCDQSQANQGSRVLPRQNVGRVSRHARCEGR